MKAMVLERFGERLRLSARPVPEVGPNDALVRIGCCGVCGTDLKIGRGELPPSVIGLPHVPGHECAGEVVEVGAGVTGLKPGEAVVVYFYSPCRECRYCRQGRENICPSVKRFGFEVPGGYAEYLNVPARQLCPVRGIPFRQAAILPDAVATAYHAVKARARVTPGERVLVVGGGGIGIHACQIARILGAEAAVAEAEPAKLLELRKLFPEIVAFNPLEQDPDEFLKNWTRGDRVDVVIETVGSAETLRWSAPSLGPGGRLVLVGYDPKRPVQLDALQVHYRELEILGTRVSTQQELKEVIRLVEDGHLTPVIGRSYALEEANEALRAVAEGQVFGRVVLDVGRVGNPS
jgi:2-desacetyl-2-hydroxyethyl bacteriochlorophyllide A dehydrogenase